MSKTTEEIDFKEILKALLSRGKLIVIFSLMSGILGICLALLLQDKYLSRSVLIIETSKQSSSIGNLSSIANITGIEIPGSIGDGSFVLNPELFKRIVYSTPFLVSISDKKMTYLNNESISIGEYVILDEHSTFFGKIVSLPSKIISFIKTHTLSENRDSINQGNALIELTEEKIKIFNSLKSNITLNFEFREGVVEIETSFSDAAFTAFLNQTITEELRDYSILYATEKSQQQLEFVRKEFQIAKLNFEETQNRLAEFKDANLFINSESSQIKEKRLQSEYDIAFAIYKDLALKLEKAKLQVNQDMPVFTTLQPAIVPLKPVFPDKKLFLVIFIVLGFTSICIYVIFTSDRKLTK